MPIKQKKEVITMNKNDQSFLVQKIRTQYTEKEHTALDELKALDKKAKRPANVFAYVFGIIGAIIMGSGMSLSMTEIGAVFGISGAVSMLIGIPVGIIGIALVCLAYPIYNRTVKAEREKIAPEIIRLADELLK